MLMLIKQREKGITYNPKRPEIPKEVNESTPYFFPDQVPLFALVNRKSKRGPIRMHFLQHNQNRLFE